MDGRLLDLLATVIECCEAPPKKGPGHPWTETVRVLATLRQFLREGTPWRSLRASASQASGSTLRRTLKRWAENGVLTRVHALLVAMLRGHPDLILDSCSVRAKRGGDLTGPNPRDRGKQGTKYHVAVTGDGVPVACVATAANVNDTVMFERLFLSAWAVLARIGTVFADKGYDAEHHRELCRRFRVDPRIHRRGQPRGSGLGKRRWPVERSLAWVRYQPGSALAVWFRQRVRAERGRPRRIAIVALARKLLVALWRYVTDGQVPEGAVLKEV